MHSAAHKALTILFRRKWLIACFILLVTGAAGSYIMSIPRVYPASTSLLVKFGREFVYRQEVGSSDATFAANYSQDEIMNSLVEIIRTWGLADQVVQEMGAANLYPRLVNDRPEALTLEAAAVQQFTRDLHVYPASRSNVIWLSYVNEDPDYAADALNRLVAAFQAKHVTLYSESRFEFLSDQVTRLDDELASVERRLEDFRRDNHVYALDEQRSQLLKQQGDIDAALKTADNDYNALSAKRDILARQIGQVPATVALSSVTERSRVILQAESDLQTLRSREQQLTGVLGDRHPQLIGVRDEIRRAEAHLKSLNSNMAGSETKGANTVHQNLQSALLSTEAEIRQANERRGGLRSQLSEITSKLEVLSNGERSLRELVRQRNEAEALYQNSQRRLDPSSR